MRAWWSWADPSRGQNLLVTEIPLSSLLEAPFFGNTAWQVGVSHPMRWLTQITFGSLSLPLSAFQISVGRRSVFQSAVHFLRPPGESRPWAHVWRPPKMPNFLVLAGSQSCYIYLKKSLQCLSVPDWDCGYTEHICWIFDSAKFIFSGERKRKHYVRSVNVDISLMPKDKQ